MNRLFIYGFGVWMLILVLAVINGTMRDFLYKNKVGDLTANQISSIILSIMIFIVTYLFLRIGHFSTSSINYVYLGLMWVIFTLAFEFLFFHYVTHHSWSELLANYNILKGNLWLVVVVSTGVAPWLMSKLV